jgi:NADH dehydrogenase [ubiquinone] 1 alpha subcomplex assembly factor 7
MSAHLSEMIRRGGPMTLETYMAQVLTHPTLGYYTTQEPFGVAGDFITAPEVSQMFGELIGVWCAHTWAQMGSPDRVCLTEAGPGRGTLMKDLLRAASKAAGFADAIEVHLIEISPRLRKIQRDVLGDTPVTWHETLDTVPTDAPLILVSNELFDALPIRQFERTVQGWCERLVDVSPTGDGFRFVLNQTPSPAAAMLARQVRDAPLGSVAEVSPASIALVSDISKRLLAQGGAGLLIDYGSDTFGARDTLQAVAHHKPHPALAAPGTADLCAHVDFAMLARAAGEAGAVVWGPVTQGAFLTELGIAERAAALRRVATEAQHSDIDSALDRLVGAKAMGSLFKVLGLSHPDLALAGFNA